MSSTCADGATTRIGRRAIRRVVAGPPFARSQTILLALTSITLVAYGVSTFISVQERWLAANMGGAMRMDATVNLAAGVVIAIGLVLRQPILILIGGAAVLWAALQQGSAVGVVPSVLLPWAVSLTVGAMLIAAARLGTLFIALTVVGVAAFGVALVLARQWAALDFAIAGFATLLAWALLDLAWRAIRGTPLP